MARRTRKRAPKRASPASSGSRPGSSHNLHNALDPLSALLKSAGLRRSDPSTQDAKPAAPKPKAKTKSARRGGPRASALAVDFPTMPAVGGVRLASMAAGITGAGQRDLMVATFDAGTQVAGIFSQSKMPSAPVDWSRKALDNKDPEARVLVVHAGNANAFTGKAGDDAAKDIAAAAAKVAKCRQRDVFLAGTGLIGVPFPTKNVTSKLPALIRGGSARPWITAARSMMTNDTFPKGATRTALIDGVSVTLNGIAKGSAMVAPNMATTLAMIFTDAAIPSDVLQALLLIGARDSFNAITTDGEVSPGDTVLAFATSKAKLDNPITRVADRRLLDFRRKLYSLMEELAQMVVRDGEGAKKLIKVNVNGASTTSEARTIAMGVANSPLVKIALGAEQPDWGAIAVAVGTSGAAADRDKLMIRINDLPVATNGAADSAFDADAVSAAMKGQTVTVDVDVGVGRGNAVIWTCDLTGRYISLRTSQRS